MQLWAMQDPWGRDSLDSGGLPEAVSGLTRLQCCGDPEVGGRRAEDLGVRQSRSPRNSNTP